MQSWNDIEKWRHRQRRMLRRARHAVRPRSQAILNEHVRARLKALLDNLGASSVGFYWPLEGEFDLRALMRDFVTQGGRAALPAVTETNRPLEFRRWWPGIPLIPDLLEVPAPKWRDLISPDVVVAPMLGFDDCLYRLGFGTGYLDRTLAQLDPTPLPVGICHEMGRLRTIYPQGHDIPMDVVITERGFRRRNRGSTPDGPDECPGTKRPRGASPLRQAGNLFGFRGI